MYLQLYVINGIGLICKLSQFIHHLNEFSLLSLHFNGRICYSRLQALRVLKDVLKEPSKALILQPMMTRIPTTTAFGNACLRSLPTRMSGAQGCRGRARKARTWGHLRRLLGGRGSTDSVVVAPFCTFF